MRGDEGERPPKVEEYEAEFVEFINKNKGSKAQNFTSQLSDKIYLFSKIEELTRREGVGEETMGEVIKGSGRSYAN